MRVALDFGASKISTEGPRPVSGEMQVLDSLRSLGMTSRSDSREFYSLRLRLPTSAQRLVERA